ncbi:DsbA family oxidoreductase [Nocardia yamanashiensis]|uniref:DsbA family oxidoreductase n=1 Tax=Nocardia yamanashiensis TaxID=209247 RepID=UPI00082BDD46|nr:DsbA family oxidoreductase [Nocardia yamanashiensis]
MKIDVVSDISCPWCFVAKARLRRALDAFGHRDHVEVNYLPFQLNPALPTTPQPLLQYWAARGGPAFRDEHAAVADIAATEGLPMRLDRALAVNTFDAHRLVWLARRDGGPAAAAAVDEALERAYFTDGTNIADPHALVVLAIEAGLDGDRIATALATDTGAAEVRASIDRALRAGIRAVPTFVLDGHGVIEGARTLAQFTDLLSHATTVASATAACCLDTGCTR